MNSQRGQICFTSSGEGIYRFDPRAPRLASGAQAAVPLPTPTQPAGEPTCVHQSGSSTNAHCTQSSPALRQVVPASLVHEVTAVPASVISAVGTGSLPDPLRVISGPALSSHGKPELLFIGGEFCPYCATERWSLVNAHGRFGRFSNLRYMRSATNDQNLATFTFHGSSYTSPYISFVPRENEDRNRNELEPINSQEQQLLSTLGDNGFPFVDIAGRYVNDAPHTWSGGFDPSILSGKNWLPIAGALQNAGDPNDQGGDRQRELPDRRHLRGDAAAGQRLRHAHDPTDRAASDGYRHAHPARLVRDRDQESGSGRGRRHLLQPRHPAHLPATLCGVSHRRPVGRAVSGQLPGPDQGWRRCARPRGAAG
jgi:hypothetical protein